MHLHFTLHLTRKHHFNCFKQLQLLLPNRFSQEEKMLTFYWCCLTTTKVSELLSKLFKLFCHARNGKLAIWLQIRVLGASKPKGCFSKVRSVRTVHALRWSHVMTEPFVKRQWSVITNNGQLTFIASSEYDDWIFSTDKRITEVTPAAQGNLFPSLDRQGCVQSSITPMPAPLLRFQSGRGQC